MLGASCNIKGMNQKKQCCCVNVLKCVTIRKNFLLTCFIMVLCIYYIFGSTAMCDYSVRKALGFCSVKDHKIELTKKPSQSQKVSKTVEKRFSKEIVKTNEESVLLYRQAQMLYRSVLHMLAAINTTVSANKVHGWNREVNSHLPRIYESLNDIEKFYQSTKESKLQKLKKLQTLVQNHVLELQDPRHCEAAKKLLCVMNAGSGMGSEMHFLAECMFVALGTGRTLFIQQSRVLYNSLHFAFHIFSHPSCPSPNLVDAIAWKGELSQELNQNEHNTVYLSTWFGKRPKTNFTPVTIPKLILDQLQDIHEDPLAWWTGQIMKYMMRVKPAVTAAIDRMKARLGFAHPIVGVHVRRTDKVANGEARFFDLSEYMLHVRSWYDRYDMRKGGNVTRRVFLATDSVAVAMEAKTRYPDYTFLHDPSKVMPTFHAIRYSHHSLVAEITDVVILSQCDYFVGTFSSNIGRLVYELMQADGDRTMDAVSLDKIYFYHRRYPEWCVAVMTHRPLYEGEIELAVGDQILMEVNNSTPYLGFGKNRRTGDVGAFPVAKVRRSPVTAPYPRF